ncbi:MAG TPA: TadE family protein [Terriglobales bacterium]|nr:TadE family protein [Terriglobales bacterium]
MTRPMFSQAPGGMPAALDATEGSQLVELAVCLPLLVVFAVGIIDFGGAFNLKHKLDIAAQQAARFASNQPSADITNFNPRSTEAIHDFILSSLLSANINTCGLAASAPTKQNLKWTYIAASNCPGTLTLTIDRGYTFQSSGRNRLTMEATHVTISYPYQWRFGRVIQLVAPGATYGGTSLISAEAIAENLN